MTARILILGAGVGGSIVANRLARRLRSGEAQIIVMDATGQHVYQPGLLYLPFNEQDPQDLVRPVRRLLDKRVELIEGAANSINLPAQSVQGNGESLTFDWLVLATGAQLLPDRVPGFSNVHHFYDLVHAVQLREILREFSGGRIVVGPTRKVYKCPPAPLEFILLLDDYLQRRRLRDKTELHFFSPFPEIFHMRRIAQIIEPLFKARGIHTSVDFNVKEVARNTIHSHEGETLAFDLAVLVPPHGVMEAIKEAGLAPDGWVPVDPRTLRVSGQENIFALGDTTALGIPKTGAVAHFQAQTVVDGLIAGVRRTGRARGYSGQVLCLIETGAGRATIMNFDYDKPGRPSRPNRLYHWAKAALNRLYWIAIPSGRV